MNKAFVREPDAPEHMRCPACGAIGEPVGPATLSEHLPAALAGKLGGDVGYCANPACDVGYFDTLGQTVPAAAMTRRQWPKDEDAPICACFGMRANEVIAAATRGDPQPIRQLIQRSQSPEARCEILAAGGRCCIGEAQRLYIRNMRQAVR